MKEEPLIEAALENVEAFIDAFADNEILKSIPVVGTALKIVKLPAHRAGHLKTILAAWGIFLVLDDI